MRYVRTYFWLILIFYTGSSAGQSSHYKFSQLDINSGLSHNHSTCFLKDSKGFLWIGTQSGLNRFDGYSVKVFLTDSQDSTSIFSNNILKLFELPNDKIGVLTSSGLSMYNPETESFQNTLTTYFQAYKIRPDSLSDVVKDSKGNYFFIRSTGGLIYYDSIKKEATRIHTIPNDSTSISSAPITSMVMDKQSNYWISYSNGVFEKVKLMAGKLKVVYRSHLLESFDNRFLNYQLLADNDGDLWIYLINYNDGIHFLDTHQWIFKHIHKDSPGLKLNTNIISKLVQDNKGLIWVGTDHGGINVIDKKNNKVTLITNHDEDSKSLAQNSITALYHDRDGIIWVGTFKKGVSYYHENIIRFPLYQHYPLDRLGLPFSDVNRFVEDGKGNLWIGTNGGGLIYFDRTNGTYKQFKNDPANPNSLSSDVIVSMVLDHQNTLWIGTYYGGLNSFDGKNFKRYAYNSKDPSSIKSRNVWELYEDSNQKLWIGTLDEGLYMLDRRTNSFSHFKSGDVNSVRSTYISAITEDRNGNMWFGTGLGLDILMRETGRFVHYENERKNLKSLSNNAVLDIHQDKNGRIWIGTYDGLNLFNENDKTFKTIKESDGLPSNSVLTILEDNTSRLWLSTPNGISSMTVDAKDNSSQLNLKFKNYDEADGLQGKQFNENAALKTKAGELIFGGSNGFNVFKPENLGLNKVPPQIVLSDFQLFNKSVKAGEKIDGRIILSKSVMDVDKIILAANKNVFSIEFVALNFFHPERNEYKYQMEGFNSDWLTADNKSRKVTFTNLDPGDYVFRVKASNNDGVWNEKGTSLMITVLPPFWKTRTAFFFYVIFIVAALLVTRKLIQQREQMKFVIRQERQEALRMHELDMMKIKFFTNVSHEFRTPLTLILTPIEKLLKQTKELDQQNQFLLIQRNARRLLNLVNRLLDFRKMEVQELRFNPSEGDIIHFIQDTVSSFSDLSEKKDIKLEFQTTVTSLETIFDQDKLEKILFNLLSNAFKFTPEHGRVNVNVSITGEGKEKQLTIEVKDTGIGISTEKQDQIFERFFQNELPKSMVNQGSGIGLSITKEFVRIHGGSILVESEVEKGSTFIVLLPVQEVLTHINDTDAAEEVGESEINEITEITNADKKPMILLVEDSEDFRFYLKDNLKQDYKVIEAKDGLEGWKQAIANLPDLIVSDVMMPVMNGIELIRKIKSDQRVSHIPIILLTARTAEEQKLEGFEAGTDEYLTKPFNFEILVSRIRNLILQREKLHKLFPHQFDVKASELQITSLDEKFIKDAIKCVEDNIASSDFSVEDMSHELGISRAHLYKKIHALTGKSPLEFIRTIKLQQAAQLLERSQLTVAEVAYKVGFNNPKYFAKYFRDEYGMLPSIYASKKRIKY